MDTQRKRDYRPGTGRREPEAVRKIRTAHAGGGALQKVAEPVASVSGKQLPAFGLYRVVSADASGAVMAWDRPERLFCPVRDQKQPMHPGEEHVVHVTADLSTGGYLASSRLDRFVSDRAPRGLKPKDGVDLLLCVETRIGYKAIVNDTCWGLLYANEVFQDLRYGQRLPGFVKKIREDGRLDVCLQPTGFQKVFGVAGQVLDHLRASGGKSSLSDSTPPQEIYRVFGVSKKQFKIALGHLYKKRLIEIHSKGIRMAAPGGERQGPPTGRPSGKTGRRLA